MNANETAENVTAFVTEYSNTLVGILPFVMIFGLILGAFSFIAALAGRGPLVESSTSDDEASLLEDERGVAEDVGRRGRTPLWLRDRVRR